MKSKKIKILFQFSFVFVLIITVLAGLLFIQKKSPIKANALVGFKPFGGEITKTTLCTCMGSAKIITVGSPNSGKFMYVPGASTKYKIGDILPGNNALGVAVRGAQIPCLVGFPPFCDSSDSAPLIRIIGTNAP